MRSRAARSNRQGTNEGAFLGSENASFPQKFRFDFQCNIGLHICTLYSQVDGDDANNRERRKCCEDNNSKIALALKSPAKAAPIRFLCLPAAAKCPVELHETLIFVTPRLRQREFCCKKGPLTVQHFEISGGAALVPHDREAN